MAVPDLPASDPDLVRFGITGDRQIRNRLIDRFSPLVAIAAGEIPADLSHQADEADLVSYGMFGLIDAIEKFDGSGAINFEAYAMTRINEAIIDELQAIYPPPASRDAETSARTEMMDELMSIKKLRSLDDLPGTGEADGGLDGVREPRRPKPTLGSGSRSLPTPD